MGRALFDGLKVIDCASFIAAPAAATIFADFGADVIKIEPPAGDPYRKLPQIKGQPQCEHNYAWLLTDRSKRSLALDLAKPEAQAALARVVASADVFITNTPLRARARLGIAYEQLAPANERLIYASFTGYGEIGEEASKPGFDSNAYWARSGLMHEVKPDAESPPARSVSGMGDHPAALALYGGILTALYRREKTGKGGHVASSLLANGLWSNGLPIQAKFCGATFTPRLPREQAPNALTNLYRCRDGRWLTLSLLEEERQWPLLVRAIEEPSLEDDPRFATKNARHARARELVTIFDHIFRARDFAEWRRRLDAAGLVFGFVATLDDVVADKQARENGVILPIEGTSLETIDSPIYIDAEVKCAPRPAPEIGESSEDILREAGFAESEIADMRAAGILM
ncbi:MAG: CoA transferase [Methylobacteriaceae bacterium]|nr:CoA transferase [Methylobacteriaceae bacterium]MBV9395684.1 CoA transferase [Methylobacteriaceae bacterium]